jgi:SlyX protein
LSAEPPHLETIETKLAFQEDALQQLSDVLIAQQERIDQLEARIELLAEQLLTQAVERGDVPDDPPPHY